MRGASALIAADHLSRFSNGSPSVIHVARDSDTLLGQTLLWPQPLYLLIPHVTLQVTSGGILLQKFYTQRKYY